MRSRYAIEERKNVRPSPSLIFLLGVEKVCDCRFDRRSNFGIAECSVVEAMVLVVFYIFPRTVLVRMLVMPKETGSITVSRWRAGRHVIASLACFC